MESGFKENPLIQFREDRLDILTFLSRTGKYKEELYVREINDDFYSVMVEFEGN